MKRHSSRLVPAALAAALVLAACGSDSPDASDHSGDSVPVVDDGLLAPRPIEVTGGGGAAVAASESDRVASDSAIMPYSIADFVVGDGMPALPTNDIGYLYQAGTAATAEQVAALAALFGVTGEPVRIDDGFSVSWRVGPDDGTAPSLWLYQDAQLGWNYSVAWADQERAVTCAEPVLVDPAEGDDAVVPESVVDPDAIGCEEPAPPVGVPSQDAAEQRVRELLTAAGEDPAAYRFESHADEWFAGVTAIEVLDGSVDGRRWDFGFGAEGVLQYAGGQLAEPARVGPYPLVDLDAAVARLNDRSGFWGGYSGGGIAVAEPAIAAAPPVDVAESDVVVDADEPMPEPMPVEPMPVEPMPEPEPVTVTLVDVQADVWWAWDVDGSVWLLPAYRFIDTDGGWHTVPAVTDEYLIRVEPPVFVDEPMPEPAPEPGQDPGVPTESMPPEEGSVPEPIESMPPEEGSIPELIDDGSVGRDPESTIADLNRLLPMKLEEFIPEADLYGFSTRVVEVDGESLDVTADYSETRINVEVKGDTVVAVRSVG